MPHYVIQTLLEIKDILLPEKHSSSSKRRERLELRLASRSAYVVLVNYSKPHVPSSYWTTRRRVTLLPTIIWENR